MKLLEEKILSEGKVFPGNVLKVSSFLNHRIDVAFTNEMGKEVASLFESVKIDKILTIETSGIPLAFAAATALGVPMVFAKKHKSSNIAGDVYSAEVYSFTHGTKYTVVVSKDFLSEGENILIIDDFLANGKAIIGLLEIISQANANAVGACCAIEKGFQGGGDALRSSGLRVESLACIESMSDNSITFRK